MDKLSDVSAEGAVLAGTFKYGSDIYYDICDVLQPDTFTDETNVVLWKCFVYLLDEQKLERLDQASVMTTLSSLGYQWVVDRDINHLRSVFQRDILAENVKRLAIRIRKLHITRLLLSQVRGVSKELELVTGEESIEDILNIPELVVFSFNQELYGNISNEPIKIGDKAKDYIEYVVNNPVPMVGLDIGLPKYNYAIGSGVRRGGITLIGARPGIGKSMLCANVAINVALKGTPVLIVDTEMSYVDILPRMLANLTFDCPMRATITEIEQGSFTDLPAKNKSVNEASAKLQELPIKFMSVVGQSFQNVLSIIRRWIYKEVGFTNGITNQCLIIYDYFHLTDTEKLDSGVQEHQLLGYYIDKLHILAAKYSVPIFCTTQLNRDGIKELHGGIIASSDRILNTVQSFSVLRMKSDDELALEDKDSDGAYTSGNAQIVILKSRYSDGCDGKISIQKYGKYGKIVEV